MTILVETRSAYRVIILNRPERLNALTVEMADDIMAALAAAETDNTCRAILLTGAGRGFCAGQDLTVIVDAAADEWGLIWRAVPDDRLMDEAHALAARLASGPTAALGLIKQAFEESAGNDLDAQLDVERDLQAEAAATPDHAEGLRAFLGKRPP